MMKRESLGEVNDLCAKLGRVEQALQCHKAVAWVRCSLDIHVDRAKARDYNGPGEIPVYLEPDMALKFLEAEEDRLRGALIDLGVEP